MGVFFANKVRNVMMTVSASLMGARLVTQFLSEQVEYLSGTSLEHVTVERVLTPPHSQAAKRPQGLRTDFGGRLAKLSLQTCIEFALAGSSLYWQLVGQGKTLDVGQRLLFAPFLVVESALRGVAVSADAEAAPAAAA